MTENLYCIFCDEAVSVAPKIVRGLRVPRYVCERCRKRFMELTGQL